MLNKGTRWGLAIVLLVLLGTPIYIFCDVIFHGPHTVAFNRECSRIVREQNLIGQSPAVVRAALGEPTSIRTHGSPGDFTWNYAPHPSFPFAKFQAHFSAGTLRSTEAFDD